MNKIKDALAPSKAASAGAIAPILEAGEFRAGTRRVPYQIYRRAHGETFEAMIRSGEIARMPLKEVIHLLLRILDCTALLEEDGLYFIHLDAANVMISGDGNGESNVNGGGSGRTCLIDPDELETGPLGPKRRKRYLRRVCRLVLGAMEEKGAQWKQLKADENVKRFVDRLELHRKTPKGGTIPEGDRFDSLAEIREGLEELKTRSVA